MKGIFTGRKYSYSWEGEDGCTESISWCGSVLVWKSKRKPKHQIGPGKKKPIYEFSRASRFNLLKALSRIDWPAVLPALFVTTTYPDSADCQEYTETSKHRYLFHRSLEKRFDRKLPCVWRKEWKPRKSGSNLRMLFPHFHWLFFNTSFIAHQHINEAWASTIGEQVYVVTDVDRVRTVEDVAPYVAKYVSKDLFSCLFAIYHNSYQPGRPWGKLRKEYIKNCTQMDVRIPESEALGRIKQEFRGPRIQRLNPASDSFTLLGPQAEALGQLIFEDFLDTGEVND